MITFEDRTRKTIRTETTITTIVKQCIGCPYIRRSKKKYHCNLKNQNKLIEDPTEIPGFCQLKPATGATHVSS